MFARDNCMTPQVRKALTALTALCATLACAFALSAALFASQADAAQNTADAQAQPAYQLGSVQAESPISAAATNPSKAQIKAFKKASADFALDLFGKSVAAKGANANVTVAPLSVLTALAMTTNGASGKTAKQLRTVLADGASASVLCQNLNWYNGQLVNVEKARISSANAIWYHNAGSLVMNPSFLEANKTLLGAEIRPANFSAPSTVTEINSWVAQKTNDMIQKLVDGLDADSRIAIVNALYFDAEWKNPYEEGDVRTAKFTNAKGKKRTVKMMHSTESRYIKGKGVTGFIRPYAEGYSYVALLPSKGTNAKKFARSLTGSQFRKLVSSAKPAHVRAGIPKYTVSYANDNMAKQLKSMGVKLAFNPLKADFSLMGTDPLGKLYIDQVIHKTKVEVDERGTKASAVTGVMMKASTAIMPAKVKTVILNRPFVYAIIDNATQLPVFIGTVSDVK